MLRRFATLGRTFLRTTTPFIKARAFSSFSSSSKPGLQAMAALFSSSKESATMQNVLSDHEKHLRLIQYVSTRMDVPSNVKRASNQEWKERGFLSQLKEFSTNMEIYEVADLKDIPGKNTPSGSWVRFKFPLETFPDMRQSFQRFFTEGIRIGRLVEIMDYVACTCAYRYAKAEPRDRKVTMATASVYEMSIFESHVSAARDIDITGYVCHVGRTSMEIRVDISHSEKPEDYVATAYFLFVGRDAKDYSKAFVLPDLTFEGEEDEKKCILRREYGLKNKGKRSTVAAKSLFKVPPSSEESAELHQLFKMTLDPSTTTKFVPIHKTVSEKLILMHLQDKNIHGKAFGGFVMREACELAWVTAYLEGDGSFPYYAHIDDVAFLRPIPIGSITNFKSMVTYIEDNLIHVQVTADNLGIGNQEERVFEVHVIFTLDSAPKPVIPFTYFDGMLYLEGKRRVKNRSMF